MRTKSIGTNGRLTFRDFKRLKRKIEETGSRLGAEDDYGEGGGGEYDAIFLHITGRCLSCSVFTLARLIMEMYKLGAEKSHKLQGAIKCRPFCNVNTVYCL
jgi:hypothetical protein